MSWTIQAAASQNGHLAIVTGANTGLGYDTALALAGKGCAVVLACRNMDKARKARLEILKPFPKATSECLILDLSSQQSVRAFVTAFTENYDKLDLLINNARFMMPPLSLVEDDEQRKMAPN